MELKKAVDRAKAPGLTEEETERLFTAVAKGVYASQREDNVRNLRLALGKDYARLDSLADAWKRSSDVAKSLVAEEILTRFEVYYEVDTYAENLPPEREELALALVDVSSAANAVKRMLAGDTGRNIEIVEDAIAEEAARIWEDRGLQVNIGRRDQPSKFTIVVAELFLYVQPGKYDVKKSSRKDNACKELSIEKKKRTQTDREQKELAEKDKKRTRTDEARKNLAINSAVTSLSLLKERNRISRNSRGRDPLG